MAQRWKGTTQSAYQQCKSQAPTMQSSRGKSPQVIKCARKKVLDKPVDQIQESTRSSPSKPSRTDTLSTSAPWETKITRPDNLVWEHVLYAMPCFVFWQVRVSLAFANLCAICKHVINGCCDRNLNLSNVQNFMVSQHLSYFLSDVQWIGCLLCAHLWPQRERYTLLVCEKGNCVSVSMYKAVTSTAEQITVASPNCKR